LEGNDLKERLIELQKRIRKACQQSGREEKNVQLIAVSKNHAQSEIEFLQKEGLCIFGESRVQELQEKNEKIANINWHFIGHLQRNKVKYLMRMPECKMIESLDSWRLAKEINKRAKKNNRTIEVLVEVNISGDENKFGILPAEVRNFMQKVVKLDHLKIKGMMTIVPHLDDPEKTRTFFREMKTMQTKLNEDGFNLPELSMGMSNDFEVAIEEGATMIRIGTALFGSRQYA